MPTEPLSDEQVSDLIEAAQQVVVDGYVALRRLARTARERDAALLRCAKAYALLVRK